jgi:zinc and cadmium transporter
MMAGCATLIGTWLILANEEWTKKNSVFLISFAAGVMLATSFFHLIPEASGMYARTPMMVFIGFLIFYILQQMVMFHPCHDESCHVHRIGTLSAIGLTVHSLLDGVAIAAGFEADFSIGIMTTMAVLLHELPEGITITGILIHSGMKMKKIVIYSVTVALATPFGAIISYFFLKNIAPPVLGILLAVTAGSFIYLAASDLIPESHKAHHRLNAVYFFLGVILIGVIGSFLK